MANVVKYKKIGDINLQGAIELDALTASNVPNASSGKKTLFLDVADTTLKTKDSSGTVATIGGGGGLSSTEVTTATTIANGKLYIANSTSNIDFTLPATFIQGFTFAILNKNTGRITIKSGATGQHLDTISGALVTSSGAGQELAINITPYDYMEFIAETTNTEIRILVAGSIRKPITVEVLTTSQTWTVPAGVTNLMEVYLIGGGGGGGSDELWGGGGGGAGGVNHLTNVAVTPAQEIEAVIGAGGAPHTVGGDTTFGSDTANGGGYGANTQQNGGNGGCGGGAGNNLITSGGTGSQGEDGGDYPGGAGVGGGGGYSEEGGGGGSIEGTGYGGDGLDLSALIGTSYGDDGWFAGGGGSGGYNKTHDTAGGKGGGGAGGKESSDPVAGTANTGGGGGGAHGSYGDGTARAGKAGGSGAIVIIY
jgi:hypothetical protein